MSERRRRFTDRLVDRFLAGAQEAHADEEGGSMVFGAITLFTLALMSWLVYVVGMMSGDRIQLQNAADSAAYSGALVEAESLESIASLNDGMAWVYYAGCRYAIDGAVYLTLANFYYHDIWVTQGGGPGIPPPPSDEPNMDIYGADFNNPGTRDQADQPLLFTMSNPSGGLTGNFVPPPKAGGMDPQPPQPQTLDYGWALLGDGGDQIFTNRFKLAEAHSVNLIPRAKYWIMDIHWAERLILAATPALVTKTCVEVAFANRPAQNDSAGSQFFVAVSDDLSRAWRLDKPTSGGDTTDPSGFTDGSSGQGASAGNGNGTGVSGALTGRYSTQKNPVDQDQVNYPDWFDASVGKLKGTYSQTRICWNMRDWLHESSGPKDHMGGAGSDFYHGSSNNTPSGHWHARHIHDVDSLDPLTGAYDIPSDPMGLDFHHDTGHGIESGDDMPTHSTYPDGTQTPLQPDFQIDQLDLAANADHHMAQVCPTCDNQQSNNDAGGGSQYVSITHDAASAATFFTNVFKSSASSSSSGGSGSSNGGAATTPPNFTQWMQFAFGPNDPYTSTDNMPTGFLPRPILAKASLFRAGITVAVWAPTISVGSSFQGSPFGMFAVASAQVGVRTVSSSGAAAGGDSSSSSLDTISVMSGLQGTSTVLFNGGTPSSLNLDPAQATGGSKTVNFYLGDGDANTSPGARWGARLVPVGRDYTWLPPSTSGTTSSNTGVAATGLKNLITGSNWYHMPGDQPQALSALAQPMTGNDPMSNGGGGQSPDQILINEYFDPTAQQSNNGASGTSSNIVSH